MYNFDQAIAVLEAELDSLETDRQSYVDHEERIEEIKNALRVLQKNRADEPEQYIDIVFASDKKGNGMQFVEIEDNNGASFELGTWVRRSDGYHVVRITPEDLEKVFQSHTPFVSKDDIEKEIRDRQRDEHNEDELRKKIIGEVEMLYPPDDHERGRDVIMNALCRTWRDQPIEVLRAIHLECLSLERGS